MQALAEFRIGTDHNMYYVSDRLTQVYHTQALSYSSVVSRQKRPSLAMPYVVVTPGWYRILRQSSGTASRIRSNFAALHNGFEFEGSSCSIACW